MVSLTLNRIPRSQCSLVVEKKHILWTTINNRLFNFPQFNAEIPFTIQSLCSLTIYATSMVSLCAMDGTCVLKSFPFEPFILLQTSSNTIQANIRNLGIIVVVIIRGVLTNTSTNWYTSNRTSTTNESKSRSSRCSKSERKNTILPWLQTIDRDGELLHGAGTAGSILDGEAGAAEQRDGDDDFRQTRIDITTHQTGNCVSYCSFFT